MPGDVTDNKIVPDQQTNATQGDAAVNSDQGKMSLWDSIWADRGSEPPIYFYIFSLLMGLISPFLVLILYEMLVHRKMQKKDYNKVLIIAFALPAIFAVLLVLFLYFVL